MGWVHTLNPMTAGGWQFRAVAPDGSWASFSTEHQMKRSGHLITVWLRRNIPSLNETAAATFTSAMSKKSNTTARMSGSRPADHLLLGKQHYRQRDQ